MENNNEEEAIEQSSPCWFAGLAEIGRRACTGEITGFSGFQDAEPRYLYGFSGLALGNAETYELEDEPEEASAEEQEEPASPEPAKAEEHKEE